MPPEPLLAGRYRFVRRVEASRSSVLWFAHDERENRPAVATLVPASRSGWNPGHAAGVRHDHLAPVLEVVTDLSQGLPPNVDAGGFVAVVARHVPGDTLLARVQERPLEPLEAVRMIHRAAGALGALHAKGCAHGAVSPLSIMISRLDPGPTPILTQLLMPAMPGYASPERASGRGVSREDDVWALYATLAAALGGEVPPGKGGFVRLNLRRLRAAGVDEDLLSVLERGLRVELADRHRAVDDLEADLVVWLAQYARSDAPRRSAPVSGGELGPQQGVAPKAPLAARSEPHRGVTVPEPFAARSDPRRGATTPEPFARRSSEPTPPRAPSVPPAPPPPERAPSERPPAREVEDEVELPPVFALAAPAPAEAPRPADPAPREAPGEEPAPRLEPAAPTPASPPPLVAAPYPEEKPAPKRGAGRSLVFAAFAAAAIGGGALALRASSQGPSSTRAPSSPPERSAPPPAPPASSAPAASASAEPEPPPSAPASAAPLPAQEASRCISAFLQPGTMKVPQDLSFVCEPLDARTAVKTLSRRLVAGGGNEATPGMREWVKLDWYQLAAYAVMRGACCPRAAPIQLPPAAPPCEALGPTLDKLAAAAATKTDVELRVLAFDKAVVCLHKQETRPYRYTEHPYSGGQVTFGAFLKRSGR